VTIQFLYRKNVWSATAVMTEKSCLYHTQKLSFFMCYVTCT